MSYWYRQNGDNHINVILQTRHTNNNYTYLAWVIVIFKKLVSSETLSGSTAANTLPLKESDIHSSVFEREIILELLPIINYNFMHNVLHLYFLKFINNLPFKMSYRSRQYFYFKLLILGLYVYCTNYVIDIKC